MRKQTNARSRANSLGVKSINPGRPSRAGRPSWWKRFKRKLGLTVEQYRRFFPTLSGSLVIAFIVWLFYAGLTETDPIQVEPFTVPSGMRDKYGYAPEAVSAILISKLIRIRQTGASERYFTFYEFGSGKSRPSSLSKDISSDPIRGMPDLETPFTGKFSLGSLVRWIKGPQDRLVGTLYQSGAHIKLILTFVPGRNSDRSTFSLSEDVGVDAKGRPMLDEAMAKIANRVMYRISPYLTAFYHYSLIPEGSVNPLEKERQTTLFVIQACLNNKDKEDDPWAYTLWGIVEEDIHQHGLAEEKYRLAERLLPHDIDRTEPISIVLYQNYGRLKFNQGRHAWLERDDNLANACWAKAEELLKKSADGGFGPAAVMLGNVESRLGKVKESNEAFAKAAAVRPADAGLYIDWGDACVRAGDDQNAIARYEKAVEIEQSYADGWNGVAIYKIKHGRLAEARSCLRLALRRFDTSGRARLGLAELSLSKGDYVHAALYFRDALIMDSLNQSEDDSIRRECRERLGTVEAQLRREATNPKKLRKARIGLAFTLWARGTDKEAQAMLAKCLQDNPLDTTVMTGLALCRLPRGKSTNIAAALGMLDKAARLSPKDGQVNRLKAYYYLAAGELELAIDQCKTALAKFRMTDEVDFQLSKLLALLLSNGLNKYDAFMRAKDLNLLA